MYGTARMAHRLSHVRSASRSYATQAREYCYNSMQNPTQMHNNFSRHSVFSSADSCGETQRTLSDLLERLGGGDRAALTTLYELTAPILFAFAQRVLRNGPDAEEVICDVYIQVWQIAINYNAARGSVMTWLVMITRARVIDRYRQNRSRRPGNSSDRVPLVEPPYLDGGPDDLVHMLQRGTALHSAIERLTPLRRHLLVLAFFQGLSHREIAAETALAVGTVKSHLRRTLGWLRQELPAQDPSPSCDTPRALSRLAKAVKEPRLDLRGMGIEIRQVSDPAS